MIQVCDSYYWSVEAILALLFGCLDLDKETFIHLLLNPSPVSKKDLSNNKGKKTKNKKQNGSQGKEKLTADLLHHSGGPRIKRTKL